MCGVFFDLSGNTHKARALAKVSKEGKEGKEYESDSKLRLVATNAHFLIVQETQINVRDFIAGDDFPKNGGGFIVSGGTVKWLNKLLPKFNDSGMVISWDKPEADNQNVSFENRDIELVARRVDGRYPDWRQVIPDWSPGSAIEVAEIGDVKGLCKDMQEFQAGIKPKERDKSMAKFNVDGTPMWMVNYAEEKEAKMQLPFEFSEQLGLNVKNLLVVLAAFEGSVNMHYFGESKAVIFEDGRDFFVLLMPIMIKSE